MGQSITGYGGRGSHRSVVQCKDVSALIASCFIRNNPDSMVMPFDDRLHNVNLNPKDSVMTNAKTLAINGGSTNCALGISYLLSRKIKKDVVIYISDNESWVQSAGYNGRGSEMAQKWAEYKKIVNKEAKLVLIDLVPNTTTQVMDSKDVLNIGGFSDTIFEVIEGFVNNDNSTRLKAVESIEL
jgi:60 kDa SS-A/Ro ribonucleoprotein